MSRAAAKFFGGRGGGVLAVPGAAGGKRAQQNGRPEKAGGSIQIKEGLAGRDGKAAY